MTRAGSNRIPEEDYVLLCLFLSRSYRLARRSSSGGYETSVSEHLANRPEDKDPVAARVLVWFDGQFDWFHVDFGTAISGG